MRLQKAMTAEVKRTRDAYLEVAEAQGAVAQPLERYRNPHDATSDFDRLDRKDLRPLRVAHFALFVPSMARRFRHVPMRGVAEYAEDDDGPFALIECPCGAKPIARAQIEQCPDCERYYTILDGKRALVFYGAMTPPGEAPEVIEDPPSDCEFGECDGSGFVLEEETNTTWDCRCRAAKIAERRAKEAQSRS